jgi:hypothetical protein
MTNNLASGGIINTLINHLSGTNINLNLNTSTNIQQSELNDTPLSILNNQIIKTMRDNNFIFISAQPDTVYFHWQIELYLYQFETLGVLDMCYAIVGYTGNNPSRYIASLMKKYPKNIICYKDTRKNTK